MGVERLHFICQSSLNQDIIKITLQPIFLLPSMILDSMHINCKAPLERGLKGIPFNSRLTNRSKQRTNQKALCLSCMAYRRINSVPTQELPHKVAVVTAQALSWACRVFSSVPSSHPKLGILGRAMTCKHPKSNCCTLQSKEHATRSLSPAST